MKIQAISICVNYADYLECVLENREHFDRWVIVTVAGDFETQKLCRDHGLECVISQVLESDGSDFNPAYNKSRAINEGLAHLDQGGWALVLDSDVLLPRHFRRRIEMLPLETQCIYGLKGRRICQDRRTFEALRHCQPWETMLARNTQPLGYFQLFNFGASHNRYPELSTERDRIHDDDCFVQMFAPEARRLLPFGSLHAGPIQTNWNSRVASKYSPPGPSLDKLGIRQDLTTLIEDQLRENATAAMIGYYPGNVASDLGRRIARLYLLDHYQVHQQSHSVLVEADRTALRVCFDEEFTGLNTVRLGPHCATAIATIPDESLDCLYLSGGFSSVCETLVDSIPTWLPKLKKGAIICGDMFDACVWQDGITAICWLLGKPDHIAASGFWWKRLPAANHHLLSHRNVDRDASDHGICLVNSSCEELEPLFLTMHSVRSHWEGPIAVYHRGNVEDALRLACWRLQCELHYLGPANPEMPLDGTDLLSVTPVQPFQRALLLRSGMLVCDSVRHLFSDPVEAVDTPNGGPYLAVQSVRSCYPLDPSHIAHGTALNDSAKILVCEGNPEEWTDSAWESWTDQKIAMLQQMAVDVRVRPDASIVVIADRESFGDLQQHWTAMRFPPETPILFVLLDVPREDAWLIGSSIPGKILHLSSDDVSVHEMLIAIAKECATEHVIFLSPTLAATPCADLFSSQEWDGYQLVIHTSAKAGEEPQFTGNVFISFHFSGMARTEYLRRIAGKNKFSDLQVPNLSVFMYLAALDTTACANVDLGQLGWGVLPRYQFVSKRFLPSSAASLGDRGSKNGLPGRA